MVNQFQWSNDFLVPDSWSLNEEDKKKIKTLLARQIPNEDLVISFLDDIGYVPYLRTPAKKGSIMLYAGMIYNETEMTQLSLYKLEIDDNFSADAKTLGNHSSLCPDLYDPIISLQGCPVEVARNNFQAGHLELSCGGIPYLEASEDLSANTICGMTYGEHYWKLFSAVYNLRKLYLTSKGEIIRDPIVLKFLDLKSLSLVSGTQIAATLPKTAPELISLARNPKTDPLVRSMASIALLDILKKTNPKCDLSNLFSTFGVFSTKKKAPTPEEKLLVLKQKYQDNDANLPDVNLATRRASAAGNLEDVKFLVNEMKADIHSTTSKGLTPEALARKYHHTDVINFLVIKRFSESTCLPTAKEAYALSIRA